MTSLFKITGEKVKDTYVTAGCLGLVFEDYVNRGIVDLKAIPSKNQYYADFGGMLLTTEKVVEVGFLVFFPHHTGMLQVLLNEAEDRGGYVKLHTNHRCLCVTLEEWAALRDAVGARSQELEAIADAQWVAWQNREAPSNYVRTQCQNTMRQGGA
jgi:hypothetical protein